MLPQGSTTSTAVMTNTNTKTKINTNFLVKPKKHEEGLPFLSKVPVGATSKHLVHQSLVFRVLLEQLVLKKEMHWFKCLSNEIKSEILRLEKLEYQIGFCTPVPSSKGFYIKDNHKCASFDTTSYPIALSKKRVKVVVMKLFTFFVFFLGVKGLWRVGSKEIFVFVCVCFGFGRRKRGVG